MTVTFSNNLLKQQKIFLKFSSCPVHIQLIEEQSLELAG